MNFLRVRPDGTLRLDDEPLPGADQGKLTGRPATSTTAALERAALGGDPTASILLHLAGRFPETRLAPDWAFFRNLGVSVVEAACRAEEGELETPSGERAERWLREAPPLVGAEYLTADHLVHLWTQLARELDRQAGGERRKWLGEHAPSFSAVGRVHFHLAERPGADELDEGDKPFAFMATFTTGRGKHRPLAQALKSSAEKQRSARSSDNSPAGSAELKKLLAPVRAAAEKSELARDLLDTGDLFKARTLSKEDAYRFLLDVPLLEQAGVLTRVPQGWSRGRPARATVDVRIGDGPASGLGIDAMLDFEARAVVDGEPLSAAEVAALAEQGRGLTLLRGRWVEVDPEELNRLLGKFERLKSRAPDGLTFAEAMRLMADVEGAESEALPERGEVAWMGKTAGSWLLEVLQSLQKPGALAEAPPGLDAELRPYQKAGVAWLLQLSRLGLGGCLADDMGLGKTIQVIALCLLRQAVGASAEAGDGGVRSPKQTLLVVPASLIGNWLAELEKFAPGLKPVVCHPSSGVPARELKKGREGKKLGPALTEAQIVITTYGYLSLMPWMREETWDLVVIDEAQAIKNAGTKQAKAVKTLQTRARIALTGTPVENRLSDLWSLFDFLNPGLLGNQKEFRAFTKKLADREQARYAPLRQLISPYLLRRKKTDPEVAKELPAKTEITTWCHLSKTQAGHYQAAVDELAEQIKSAGGMKRRGLVLAFLTRFKQICNHPDLYLGGSAFEREHSGKLARLGQLAEEMASRQTKVLVFTQYRSMTGPLAAFLTKAMGAPGVVLHGETPVEKRRELVDRFQNDDRIPFFVLSLKAGGTGLNLTAASQVVHFDRWWNPAVEAQATDRAFRLGQPQNVLVHKLVCKGTVEERIDQLIRDKEKLADELLERKADGAEVLLTELEDDALLELVKLDVHSAVTTEAV